ncbi:hypothetical protein KFK09_007484 [Dendrobium nobile]|uniref:Reverse transcriptase zinc-binding domain-containing protein n=1 Tax=Dendrobium nobile TaxID=94219 RepID=A0A8T3BUG9_DENNO|nr:hypothetical protein KFK09_007484 [Dendrobium nobile]
MALIGKLKTTDNLIFRGIQVEPQCFLCSCSAESHAHLFFECDFSFNILKNILPDFNVFLLRPNLFQAFEFIAQHEFYSSTEKDFCCLTVSCIVYHLWRERNSRRFSNIRINLVKLICNITAAIRLKIAKWKNKEMLLIRFTGI